MSSSWRSAESGASRTRRPGLAVALDDERRRTVAALRIGAVADEPEGAARPDSGRAASRRQLDRRHAGEAAVRERQDRDVVREALRVEIRVDDRDAAADCGHGERKRELLGEQRLAARPEPAGLPGRSVTTHSASGGANGMQCAAVRNSRSDSTEPLHRSAGGVGPAPSTSKPSSPTFGWRSRSGLLGRPWACTGCDLACAAIKMAVAARGGRQAIWRDEESERVLFHTDPR